MINFRYHVVSMTAVFLALAIGLVLGTTALNGPVADTLSDQITSLSKTNQNLREQVGHVEEELKRQEQFVADLAPSILAGKLAGKRVLLLDLSGAKSEHVDGVRRMLEFAGAKVTSRVSITDEFTNPAKNDFLLDQTTKVLPSTVTDPPTNSYGAESAAAVLAAVLLDHNPPVTKEQRTIVLTAFVANRFISVVGDVSEAAEAVVVVSGQPSTDRDALKRNDAVVMVTEHFDRSSPIVVAAPNSGGEGNVVAALRGDPALSKTISTVDNVSGAVGQLVTALALIEQFAGKPGHYGVGGGSAGVAPKVAKS
ncbi:MAG: copper transporter [Longispora sp.]|nr:copper transporter [Longispora sp. (in: high G+C Gram-positive bacteria)]